MVLKFSPCCQQNKERIENGIHFFSLGESILHSLPPTSLVILKSSCLFLQNTSFVPSPLSVHLTEHIISGWVDWCTELGCEVTALYIQIVHSRWFSLVIDQLASHISTVPSESYPSKSVYQGTMRGGWGERDRQRGREEIHSVESMHILWWKQLFTGSNIGCNGHILKSAAVLV